MNNDLFKGITLDTSYTANIASSIQRSFDEDIQRTQKIAEETYQNRQKMQKAIEETAENTANTNVQLQKVVENQNEYNFIDTNPIEKRLSMHFMLNLWLYRFYSIVPTILFMSPSESTMMVFVLLGAT